MRITVPRTQPKEARIILTIAHKADPDAETVRFLTDLIAMITRAANNGAFRRARLPNGQAYASAATFLPGGRHETTLQMDLKAVDLRFVECLRAAFEVQGMDDQIESIAIDTDPASGDIATIAHPNGVESRAIYPPLMPTQLPMDEQYESASRMHQIIVEFGTDVDAQDIKKLGDFVEPWGALLEAGAFALPNLEPTLVGNVMGPTQMFEANSIEVLIDRFQSDLEGMNPLLNMIDTYAERTHGIRRATLY